MTWPLILIIFLAPQLTWHEYYERGEKRFGRNEFAACIEDMRQAIAEKPESRKNQFTRAVQKIEYKPYYYLALSHQALADLPQAFEYAQLAYDGEVVAENPVLQSDLAPILEAYRAEVQELHGQITREEELIAERARLIDLLLKGEIDQVRRALARTGEPERFRDIQMYLNLRDDVRDQLNQTQRDVIQRIDSWLDQGDVVKARALFDGVSNMLSPDGARDLASRIATAEALIPEPPSLPEEETPEPIIEPAIDPEEIEKYRKELATAEAQTQNLDQQVTLMTEQNRLLRRELDLKRAEPTRPDLSEYPPGVFLEIERKGKGIRFEGHAMSPAPIVSWQLTLNGSPIALDEEAVSRDGANMVFARHVVVDAYGTHEIGLEIEDSLGRTANAFEPFTLQRPWFHEKKLWWTLVSLFLLGVASRFMFLASRRRKAMLRHFNPYVAGHPVRDDEMFYGRDQLLNRIQHLVHKNSFMIHGNRRIGKTSLLLQLSRNLTAMDSPEYVFYPVYLDLQGLNEIDLFHHMMAELLTQAEEWHIPLDDLHFQDVNDQYQSRHFSRDIKHIIQRLKTKHKRHVMLVLLMDEVDVLNEFGEKTNQKLRGIFMKDFAEHLTCVMAGIHLKKEWESSGSPWYNFFEEIPVRQINEKEARRLILEPVKGIFSYHPDAVDLILKETAGHPYLIQKLCVSLIGTKLEQHQFTVERNDVVSALENLQEEKARSA